MKHCYICAAEFTEETAACPQCRFDCTDTVFLNQDHHAVWVREHLLPARCEWQRQQEEARKAAEEAAARAEAEAVRAYAGRIREQGAGLAFAGSKSCSVILYRSGKIGLFPVVRQLWAATEWENITMVACGSSHLLGLTAEGRVLAAGEDHLKQCDTAEWSGIVQICAWGDTSAALGADGRLYACGEGADRILEIAEEFAAQRGRKGRLTGICLNRTQLVLLAEDSGGRTHLHYAVYRDILGAERTLDALYDGPLCCAAGFCGTFLLHDGTVRTLNTAQIDADSIPLAERMERVQAQPAARIAAGRETLYSYSSGGIISYVRKDGSEGSIALNELDGFAELLAAAETPNGTLLAAVRFADGIRVMQCRDGGAPETLAQIT